MKTMMCLLALSTLFLLPDAQSQSYHVGDTLYVTAQSGLRLRTSPNTQSGTITILEPGEHVTVIDDQVPSAHLTKAGWFDGRWIRVSKNHIDGYLFDAYLSSLAPITHEDELCFEPYHFSVPVTNYLHRHYVQQSDEQGSEHREDVDQCVTHFSGHIALVVTQGNGWYKTDVLFHDHRITEVVQLLRNMLIGNDAVEAFDNSLTFYTDDQGETTRIRGGVKGHSLEIAQHNGKGVIVSFTDLTNS